MAKQEGEGELWNGLPSQALWRAYCDHKETEKLQKDLETQPLNAAVTSQSIRQRVLGVIQQSNGYHQ